MALTIGSDVITSDRTVHSARRLPRDFIWWEVSYLPGRRMDQQDAVTAMKLADEAGREYSSGILRTWISLEIWGGKLNLAPGDVIDYLHHCPPAWPSGERAAHPDDTEYFPRRKAGKAAPRRKAVKASAEHEEPEAGG